ncbi:MAG: hypothetical protein Q9209_002883 [Squamulea sp. 1 TL-2023]
MPIYSGTTYEALQPSSVLPGLAATAMADIELDSGLDIKHDQDSNIAPGSIGKVHNLYQSKPDKYGSSTWVDKYPEDLEEPAENSKTARYALLVRNRKSYAAHKKLQIDSFLVQSPLLKTVLGRVFKNYPGITTSLERLKFNPPFKPFVHRWADFIAALRDEEDLETKSHLQLLHDIMEEELREDLKAKDDHILNGVTTYENCWMLFEPGSIVFSKNACESVALRLKDASYGAGSYNLQCSKIDWDGNRFGYSQVHEGISLFGGTKAITELEVFPLQYHDRPNEIIKELVERGRIFERLSGYHYKQYTGIAYGSGPWGMVNYNVDSRILIDTYAWNRFNPNNRVRVGPLDSSSSQYSVKEMNGGWDDEEAEKWNGEDADEYTSDEDENPPPKKKSQSKETPRQVLTNEQLLLCSTTIRGYSLRNKKWLTFSIRSIGEIRWNDTAFDRLVLPQDHKELILALIESQVANKETFDDVIQGKGKGMIMLLSGPPGVGKTLTAESVSENIRAPLYIMSAGDLGTTSSDVESSLSNVLEMCTKWNAVLLIDEADVFLEQRSSHDLERNKLVSIFLRLLEYYEGILFLTTNRVNDIDPAFQSRIHISMEYQPLSSLSRRQIWSSFLASMGGGANSPTKSKLKPYHFEDKDLDKLAEYQMNGREIKNVLKTAQLLAGRKGEGLAVGHVESVLGIEKRHVR